MKAVGEKKKMLPLLWCMSRTQSLHTRTLRSRRCKWETSKNVRISIQMLQHAIPSQTVVAVWYFQSHVPSMFPSRTRAQHTKSAHNPPPIIVIRHGAWRGVHSSISESSKHPLLPLVGKLATHTQFSTQNRMAPKPNVRFMLSQ